MKNKENAANNIILNDKEMEILMRQQEVFFQKVKNFLNYYESDLVALHDEKSELRVGNDFWRIKRLIDDYYNIICSMYAVFQRKEGMTQAKVVKFAKDHFGIKYNCISDKIDHIYYFTHTRLDFSNEVPEYKPARGWGDTGGERRLYQIKDFEWFASKYANSRHRINYASLAVIWIIEKYF